MLNQMAEGGWSPKWSNISNMYNRCLEDYPEVATEMRRLATKHKPKKLLKIVDSQ